MHTAQVKDQKNITDGGLARLYNIQLSFHQTPYSANEIIMSTNHHIDFPLFILFIFFFQTF
jgi:hypothetical protein